MLCCKSNVIVDYLFYVTYWVSAQNTQDTHNWAVWIFGEHQLQNLECEHHFVHLYTEDLARRWFCDVRAVPSFRTWSAQTVMHTPHIGVPPFRYLYLLFFSDCRIFTISIFIFIIFSDYRIFTIWIIIVYYILVTAESLLFG